VEKISAERKNMEILSKKERKEDREDRLKAKVQSGRARRLFLVEMFERSGSNPFTPPPSSLVSDFANGGQWMIQQIHPKTSVFCQRAQNFNLDFGKCW
jgi:hypothetical protein